VDEVAAKVELALARYPRSSRSGQPAP